MPLVMKRREGETWIQCMLRYAAPYGLESEVLSNFWKTIRVNNSKTATEEAVFGALWDWDLLDFEDDTCSACGNMFCKGDCPEMTLCPGCGNEDTDGCKCV
jgi:hypothetical protein